MGRKGETCMACALLQARLAENDSLIARQRKGTLNILIELKAMLEAGVIDEALEILTQLTEGE